MVDTDGITITNSMNSWTGDDKTKISVPTATVNCGKKLDGTADKTKSVCAWECARLCNSYDPSKPCRSFAWHQGKQLCYLYGMAGTGNTADKLIVGLDQDVVNAYDPTYSADNTALKGWAYFELGHWYIPKQTNNAGTCTIKAADDWEAAGNAEVTDDLNSAWNSKIQATCALIKDFPNAGACDADTNC